MKEEKIVMYSSDEAAKRKTVTGWVSRNGYWYGDNEHAARWCGCTHRVCECGEVVSRSSYCVACYFQKRAEKYAVMPRQKWDGKTMVYSESLDRYFYDEAELSDYCADNDAEPSKLMLVICEPVYAEAIDPNDYYCDDLPEDGEVDGQLADAFDQLNKFIRESKTILSWTPGKSAVDFSE